jgi:AmpD protein
MAGSSRNRDIDIKHGSERVCQSPVTPKSTERSIGLSSLSPSGYTIDRSNGLIHPASQSPSPHQDARPGGAKPTLIVLHGIALPPGEFGGPYIEQLFTNRLDPDEHPHFAGICELRVSAHILIRRDGTLIQFVPFSQRAWHAGESEFRGVPACNDYSIGIEMEGDDNTNYSDHQYRSLAGAVAALMRAYSELDTRRIAGHCDIAPGRKTDPGPAFDWLRLYDGIARQNSESI